MITICLLFIIYALVIYKYYIIIINYFVIIQRNEQTNKKQTQNKIGLTESMTALAGWIGKSELSDSYRSKTVELKKSLQGMCGCVYVNVYGCVCTCVSVCVYV